MYQVTSTLKSLEFVRYCVSANDVTNCACPLIGTVPKCCHFEERTGASCNRFGSNPPDTEIDDSHRTCNQQITIKNFLALPLLCQTNDGENTNGSTRFKRQVFYHALNSAHGRVTR